MCIDVAADFQTWAGLAQVLKAARQYTLAIYAHLTPEQLQVPRLPTVNPPLWELAHIAWFQEYWCRRFRPGRQPLASRYPDFDAWYDSSFIPHAERWTLPHPPMADVVGKLEQVLGDALSALEYAQPSDLYYFGLAALHESMHAEALLMTLQTLALPAPLPLRAQGAGVNRHEPRAVATGIDIAFTGGAMSMGSAPSAMRFVFDNEKWTHPVQVAPFAMAAACVTNGEFAGFVGDGGYRHRELWTGDGWRWLTDAAATHPVYWRDDSGAWQVRRFERWESLDDRAPASHVNFHEAAAYCAWAGRRLPTEMEWEWAARAGGDRPYPWGNDAALLMQCALGGRLAQPAPAANDGAGCGPLQHMIGNVWEWTASPFVPYPGFATDPYRDYSAPWFGNHQVIRGGSLFTAPWLIHNRFRNFYQPHRSDMFVGFRTCALP